MSTDSTYIVQVFTNFAPAESNPLLLRLELSDAFRDLAVKAIAKLREKHPVGVFLPSEKPEDFVCFAAGGDGFPDARKPRPFVETANVRSAGLDFPYMIALVYDPLEDAINALDAPLTDNHATTATTAAAAITSSQRKSTIAGGATPISGFGFAAQHQRAATLTQEEKAEAERRRAEVEARRAENLRRIERQRLEKERAHFQHCESYEVLRREQALEKQRAAEEAAKLAELQQSRERLRAEVVAEKEAERQFTLLEQHRDEMHAKVAEERERRQRMAEQRERKLAEAAAAKEEARRLQLRTQEAERERRMKESLDSLLGDLDRKCGLDHEAEASRLHRERQQRLGAQQAELELHRVAQLEDRRNLAKRSERRSRLEIADFERSERERSIAVQHEASALDELREEERFHEWHASRQGALEAMKTRLELEYRQQSASDSRH